MSVRILDLTSPEGAVIEPRWLAPSYPVHAQLRPELSAERYAQVLERVFADGARMTIALLPDASNAASPTGERVAGVSIWRHYRNTHDGHRFYVDDLVTDAALRSGGVGRQLLKALRDRARALGCDSFTLDSGTHRTDAHRFYFRERMVVGSFAFRQKLT